jgi:hypothetical protein
MAAAAVGVARRFCSKAERRGRKYVDAAMSQDVEVLYPPAQSFDGFGQALTALRCRANSQRAYAVPDRLAALQALSDVLLTGRSDPQPGLAFLTAFLRESNLTHLIAREVPQPDALDRFVSIESRKSLRLTPRGVVGHWIAGNVPLLGMFSWVMSALVGNANVVRLSSRQDDFVSPLLGQLAEVSDVGRALADCTLVVRFDRDNATAQAELSQAVDVRIAWGGQEAVEAIRRLPCRWDCEDIVLGPRASFAVVEPSAATEAILRRLATDIVFFDQLACSSPQYVFVRGRRGDQAFESFVETFASLFGQQAQQIPRHKLDFAETYQIHLDRSRVLLEGGSLQRDRNTQWTVAVMDTPQKAIHCANRFVQIVPFQRFDDIYPQLPANVQTVVTVLDAEELLEFTEEAAMHGVCRFPRPGEGNHFESPWDGISLVSRLTRWVVRSEPRT